MFDLFGFEWDGAFFLDVGNVWTLKEDPERPLSNLSWEPEFAFRPDGITTFKTQDNVFNAWHWRRFSDLRVRDLTFNIDLGYPF